MRIVSSRGFTLLEVLIALLIFSLGMLGLAGLMVVSVKTNHSAYLRTQASFLAQSMADRMRANISQVNNYNGDYDASTAGAPTCTNCNPAGLLARDSAVWSQQLIDSLPNPTANINCTGTVIPASSGTGTYDGLCEFTITWAEAKLDVDPGSSAPPPQTFAWVFQP